MTSQNILVILYRPVNQLPIYYHDMCEASCRKGYLYECVCGNYIETEEKSVLLFPECLHTYY